MFEFGRDLRKLFEKARESDDLGWLELIGADLVEAEARALTTDAGRVSCARPFDAWMRASTLWREHARRTGRKTSLERAASAASDAARSARGEDQAAAARLESVEIHRLRFDLFGGPEGLALALSDLAGVAPARPQGRAWATALDARLRARLASAAADIEALAEAAELMDAALRGARALPPPLVDALRLERAGVGLELGLARGDPAPLDQAGRDLRALVEGCASDRRPVTRARALALAGAGMRALAELAGDAAVALDGRALFESAADQFTPDHSPLDWAAVQLAHAPGQVALSALRQVEGLTREPGLVLGALARERRVAAEIALACAMGDLGSLASLEAAAFDRLRDPALSPLGWAAEQIALARVAAARARFAGAEARGLGLVLSEAAFTAREHGAPLLADRADAALRELRPA